MPECIAVTKEEYVPTEDDPPPVLETHKITISGAVPANIVQENNDAYSNVITVDRRPLWAFTGAGTWFSSNTNVATVKTFNYNNYTEKVKGISGPNTADITYTANLTEKYGGGTISKTFTVNVIRPCSQLGLSFDNIWAYEGDTVVARFDNYDLSNSAIWTTSDSLILSKLPSGNTYTTQSFLAVKGNFLGNDPKYIATVTAKRGIDNCIKTNNITIYKTPPTCPDEYPTTYPLNTGYCYNSSKTAPFSCAPNTTYSQYIYQRYDPYKLKDMCFKSTYDIDLVLKYYEYGYSFPTSVTTEERKYCNFPSTGALSGTVGSTCYTLVPKS